MCVFCQIKGVGDECDESRYVFDPEIICHAIGLTLAADPKHAHILAEIEENFSYPTAPKPRPLLQWEKGSCLSLQASGMPCDRSLHSLKLIGLLKIPSLFWLSDIHELSPPPSPMNSHSPFQIKSLKKNLGHSLKHLSLIGCGLTDEAIQASSCVFEQFEGVESLDLSYNELSHCPSTLPPNLKKLNVITHTNYNLFYVFILSFFFSLSFFFFLIIPFSFSFFFNFSF